MTNNFMSLAEFAGYAGITVPTEREMSVQLDIDSAVEGIEGWLRRKLTNERIEDERHVLTPDSPLFLHWGTPQGNIDVKEGSTGADVKSYSLSDFALRNTYGNLYVGTSDVYISYFVDDTPVKHYENTIKSIIVKAVMQKYLLPDIARFGAITSYSVEGLSISYNNGEGGMDKKMVSFVDILPLRRSVVL